MCVRECICTCLCARAHARAGARMLLRLFLCIAFQSTVMHTSCKSIPGKANILSMPQSSTSALVLKKTEKDFFFNHKQYVRLFDYTIHQPSVDTNVVRYSQPAVDISMYSGSRFTSSQHVMSTCHLSVSAYIKDRPYLCKYNRRRLHHQRHQKKRGERWSLKKHYVERVVQHM